MGHFLSLEGAKKHIPDELMQLLADGSEGYEPSYIVNEMITEAESFAMGYIATQYTKADCIKYKPDLLKSITLNITRYMLYRRVTSDLPEGIEKDYADALSMLKMILDGKIKLPEVPDNTQTGVQKVISRFDKRYFR